jgi:hypothetical protein
VATTAATDDLTPTSGKKIRILGFLLTSTVTAELTSTVRSTLAFGEDHITDATKILSSSRNWRVGHCILQFCTVNVIGEIDEVVRLTNTTFSAGGIITRSIVYYREE